MVLICASSGPCTVCSNYFLVEPCRLSPRPFTSSGFVMDANFDPDLIRAIFKLVWSRRTERNDDIENPDIEVGAATSKKTRPTTANPSALKVSCELLRLFVTEAIERAAIIVEAEGINKIEPTHFERILPQLLLDF